MVRCKELLEMSDSLSVRSRPATLERAYAPWLELGRTSVSYVSTSDGILWKYHDID